MFFTKVGRFLGYSLNIFATLFLVFALLMAGGIFSPDVQRQYLGFQITRDMIDVAKYTVGGFIFLNLLIGIARALRNRS